MRGDSFGNLSVDGRIILNWILGNYGVGMGTLN